MNDELLRGITSAADRDALSRLPSDPLADLRQALDTIAKASQVIVVHPEHREVADQAVAASPFPGLLEVVVTQHAPRDRVFLIPKPATPATEDSATTEEAGPSDEQLALAERFAGMTPEQRRAAINLPRGARRG